MTLREKLFNAIWRCGFAPDEDPQLVEIRKFDWPDDVARVEKRADAALSALRQWLADEGLVVVPREGTPEMWRAAQMNSEVGAYVCSNWAEAYDCIEQIYRVMIAAAPDALGEKT